jgi:hypothetical protein
MKEILLNTWDYLLKAGVITITQIFVLFGPLLILALIMNFVSRKNETLGYKIFGQKVYLTVFGWLGTSVHELGHAIFAILFAHKISEIKLFSPNSGKSLGHVKHSYTKGNPYQTLGNFFIGLGPVLFGSLLLWLVALLLFDLNIFRIAEKHEVVYSFRLFESFESAKTAVVSIGNGVWECLSIIFSRGNWWKLALFFYLFYAIGSSITLSGSDIKGAFRGFIYFVIILLMFNLSTIWIGSFAIDFFKKTNHFLSGFYFLIILSIGLNVIFIAGLFLIGLVLPQNHKKNPARKSK